jgi:hypothetical protein
MHSLVCRGCPSPHSFVPAYLSVTFAIVNYLPWMPFLTLRSDVRVSYARVWRPATLYTWSASTKSCQWCNVAATPHPSLPHPTLYFFDMWWYHFIQFFSCPQLRASLMAKTKPAAPKSCVGVHKDKSDLLPFFACLRYCHNLVNIYARCVWWRNMNFVLSPI